MMQWVSMEYLPITTTPHNDTTISTMQHSSMKWDDIEYHETISTMQQSYKEKIKFSN